MSTIELKWTDRVLTASQSSRRFLDFVVDGRSLYPNMGDYISPLGWVSADWDEATRSRLLLIGTADFPDNRRSIYVCPECADLGCGAVSALIERVDDQIVWRDFGYQNNYDESIFFDNYADLGPFIFDAEDYSRAIKLGPWLEIETEIAPM